MNKLITDKSPKQLIYAYLNNATFHAVVTKHEIAGSAYTTMLEEAVAVLAQDVSGRNKMLIKYAKRYGALND